MATVDLTDKAAAASGGTLYRGLLALLSDGGENIPHLNSGTENVGTTLAAGHYWIASQAGILCDSAENQKDVAAGDVLVLLTATPTTVDHVNIVGGAIHVANIATNTADIATNVADIATNVADIATNTADIATNTADIATNAAGIGTNVTDIATNAAGIAANGVDIGTNTAAIALTVIDIGSNVSDISTNAADIATNAGNIATNVADIATNAADILTNAGNITSNDADIVTLTADVATNTADIGTNTAAIALTVIDIGSNVTDIATNVADIATNAGNIATNAADIADLEANASVDVTAYTSTDPALTDQVIFGDASDSDATKRTTLTKIRELMGIANQGIYRGDYVAPGFAGPPTLPSKDDGTIAVGTLQSVGDIYRVTVAGEISSDGITFTRLDPGDLLILNTAPATDLADVDVVKFSTVWDTLYDAAADDHPLTSTDEILVNRDAEIDQTDAGRVTMADLITFIRSTDDTFSTTELATLHTGLGVRNPTKIARYILTAELTAGTALALDGSDAGVTLLSGSVDDMVMPATKEEYEDNPDIQVYAAGLAANKVLDTTTYDVGGGTSLTHLTANYSSTTAIVFQSTLPEDTVIEIRYANAPASIGTGGAGEPPAPPPPASITLPMMEMATVELEGMVTGDPATFSVLSVSGDAIAEIRGSEMVVQSGIEAGPITVQYRATQGATTTDGSLEMLLTDTFTLASAEAFVLYDIDNLIALGSSFEGNQQTVYEASYTCLGLRNMFQGTGDRLYFDKFKTLIDAAIADATNLYTATATGNPVVSGVPHEDYGGDTTTDAYSVWQDPVTFEPNQKAVDQFAMTALLFLYDVLEQNGEATVLTAGDRTWAETTAYAFIAKNCIEFTRTKYGDGGVHIGFVAKSAHERVVNTFTSYRWGYWNSNIGVAAAALTIDTAVRTSLALGDHSYIAVQDALATSEDWLGNFGHAYDREDDWWEKWKDAVVYDASGRATWGVGNPKLSAGNGWAVSGEEKAPDIGHGYGRYAYWCWLKVYLGQDLPEADTILNGLDRNWSEVCVQPYNYVTPDGDFAGQIADGIQVSNYINGVDTSFRLEQNAVNSTAGMGSFSYYSQLGYKRAESRAALARLYRNAIVFQSTGSKERTGTWERHTARNNYGTPATSAKYSGFGLLGNYLAALKQPL